MEVRLFHTVDGSPAPGGSRVPFTDLAWSEDASQSGQLNLTIAWHRLVATWGARRKLTPWKYCLAVVDDDQRVLFAGPITARQWDGTALSVTAADAWGLLAKRLVLPKTLDARWIDGEVLLDEDNPAPHWILQIRGQSLFGIGAALIRETLKWGDLLIDSPGSESGTNVRTYRAWDFAPVADRLRELTEVRNGPVIRFAPYIRADGNLRIRYTESEARTTHYWIQAAPGQRVSIAQTDEDGASMVTEAYTLGGRHDDIVLAARSRSTTLTSDGFPVLQVADTSHSTVTELATLLGHARRTTDEGALLPEAVSLVVARSLDVVPGDWIDLEVKDPYLGETLLPLIVATVSGDATEWQTVGAVPRGA